MELLELQLLIGWWSGFEPRSTPVQSKKITELDVVEELGTKEPDDEGTGVDETRLV